ncbi:MAG: cupredoxin domain-containing protein [Thermomicrobiales bacterium]
MSTVFRRRGLLAPTALMAVALLLGAVITGGGQSVRAQDAAGHPGHIHSGTCAELGDVVFPLENAGGGTMMGTPVAAEMMGPETAIPALVSITTVEADLATIIDGGHAINFHESAENMGNYVACGDIGGAVMGSDLAIGIGELNDSGLSGAAWLHDNGDGTTTVAVFLTQSGEATDAAAADGGEAAADAVAVDIVDFSFSPDPLDVAVGTSVTWTNQDSAPHTATSSDGGATFQSDRLEQGASYSFTFEEAGTFEYFCEFHPNMSGTVNVQ